MRDEDLLPDLHRHFPSNGNQGYNVLDFVFRYGSVLEALMFSCLFWPEFVEIEDMVFLKETAEQTGLRDRIGNALEKWAGDRSAIERSFNLKETTIQLLGKDLKHTTDEQIDWFEQRLSEMWAARLSKEYPNRRFVVEIVALDPNDPQGETGITFYEAPDDSRK